MQLPYLQEHYGDLASVTGLLVSFIGFLVTISNVRKAKRAAEEARRAAREAVSRIKYQILVSDVLACLAHVRKVDSGCGNRAWDDVLESCDEARTLLSKVSAHEVLDQDERKTMSVAIEIMGLMIPYVDRMKSSKPEQHVTATKRRELHKIITSLSKLQGRLESQTFEV
jgi:hypothetical protein